MKQIDLGQLVGVLANVGVLIGILLLVFELNQSRQMMEAQTRDSIADAVMTTQLTLATNPELMSAIMRMEDGEELTPLENRQVQSFWIAAFRNWENQHYQYRLGLYDQQEYDGMRETWRRVLSNKPTRDSWCNRVSVQSAPFISEIDELLGDSRCD